MTSRPARPLALLALVAALGAAACGDDGGGQEGGSAQTTEQQQQTSTPAGGGLKDTGTKPTVEKPTGSPPRRLEKEDIVKGTGAPAKRGKNVTVHYVGVSFSTGEQFDASWDSGQPFSFELGAGQVIAGWDQGVAGMRKGGRRKLVIPPELAYGAQGSPPAIAPNETLIFVIDLLEVG
jgi:peptidylprolyl isomerase